MEQLTELISNNPEAVFTVFKDFKQHLPAYTKDIEDDCRFMHLTRWMDYQAMSATDCDGSNYGMPQTAKLYAILWAGRIEVIGNEGNFVFRESLVDNECDIVATGDT